MRDVTGRVVHTGQAIVDLALEIDALPAAGGDTFARSWSLQPGGGFNVMAAARRQGAAVLYTGGHGTGPFGDLVREAMAAEGVEVLAPVEVGTDTGFSIALTDDSAERTFVSTVGAEGRPEPEVLDSAGVTSGDVVYVSGYSLHHETNGQLLARWLPTLPAGIHVVLDPSPILGEIPSDILGVAWESATVLTLNETEARVLLRHVDGEEGGPGPHDQLVGRLRSATGTSVVLRTGPDGCWVAEGDRAPVHVPGLRVTAADTNGAGDAHAGVLCAGLCRAEELLDVARRANAAAALAVTRRGPATAPTRDETDDALRAGGRSAS